MTRSDRELLRAHLGGDRLAFSELVDRYSSTMWAIARRTMDSYDDAADVVQEALISAHQSASRCRTKDSARGWLVRIVVNACYDRHRRNRCRPCDPMPDEVIERLPAPRDPIAEHQLTLDVQSALTSLPMHQRVAVVLVDMHGYPTAEVADMLGIPVGTVKSRCSRARQQLAVSLGRPMGAS